jgi:hypothetical protein
MRLKVVPGEVIGLVQVWLEMCVLLGLQAEVAEAQGKAGQQEQEM